MMIARRGATQIQAPFHTLTARLNYHPAIRQKYDCQGDTQGFAAMTATQFYDMICLTKTRRKNPIPTWY
jgi:hypothetical protein